MNSEDIVLYEKVVSSRLLERLPKQKLGLLMRLCTEQRKVRFPRNHSGKRYGNLRRDFTDEEYERYIKFADHPKARLCLQSMHYGGLRIGEAVAMKLEHIDFMKQMLIVHTEKTGLIDQIPICEEWWQLLRNWVNQHHKAILQHDGFIFWSDNPTMQNEHISTNWLRNYSAQCRREAGLTQTYGESFEKNGRTPRRLYRLVPHSHRKSFGTKLWQTTRDLKLVQVALRHTNWKSTSIYVSVSDDSVRTAIQEAFRPRTIEIESRR